MASDVGYVYVVNIGQSIKIGRTCMHPMKRVSKFNITSLEPVQLVSVLITDKLGSIRIERFLHSVLQEYRVGEHNRELFCISVDYAVRLMCAVYVLSRWCLRIFHANGPVSKRLSYAMHCSIEQLQASMNHLHNHMQTLYKLNDLHQLYRDNVDMPFQRKKLCLERIGQTIEQCIDVMPSILSSDYSVSVVPASPVPASPVLASLVPTQAPTIPTIYGFLSYLSTDNLHDDTFKTTPTALMCTYKDWLRDQNACVQLVNEVTNQTVGMTLGTIQRQCQNDGVHVSQLPICRKSSNGATVYTVCRSQLRAYLERMNLFIKY